nr:unnamed protein product [Callosobruchus analis]
MSAENQLPLILSYYSNGSFLRVSGDFCGAAKSTASKTIQRPQFINMSNDCAQEAREKFYQTARFPRCIGCTDVKIQSPGGETAELSSN